MISRPSHHRRPGGSCRCSAAGDNCALCVRCGEAGILLFGLAWFGLKAGQVWALWIAALGWLGVGWKMGGGGMKLVFGGLL